MSGVILCMAPSPHGTVCSLRARHDGTHYDRFSECVWDEDGLHMHEGRTVEEGSA